ncbi:MAG: DinB family protein [Gemmatimonadaceae bacterium]
MTNVTTAAPIARPQSTEYAPYYDRYISLVPDGDLVELLRNQIGETLALLRSIPEERASDRYAPGKWSVKEVVGHLADVERIMTYRMLRIARGDATPLPGFDENAYVPAANFEARTLASLAHELEAVRQATIAFVETLEPEAAARRGSANNLEISARALAYIIAGHERHHVGILRERYLNNA